MNVVKIAPETALRLTLNDRIKAVVAKNHMERITPWERMACGGLAGASAQVTLVIPFVSAIPNLWIRTTGHTTNLCISLVLAVHILQAGHCHVLKAASVKQSLQLAQRPFNSSHDAVAGVMFKHVHCRLSYIPWSLSGRG